MSESVPEGWTIQTAGNVTELLEVKSEFNNQYEPLTSSRLGLIRQRDYFKKQVTSSDNTGYKIISKGEFTYRSMSDDGTFKFNRSKFSEKGIVSPAYDVFRCKGIEGDYLEYIFDSVEFSRSIYSLAQGGTRLALKYNKFSEIKFYYPPLPEQKKIASILTSVDEVIEKTQSQIDKLQDLKKATMNELLTKGIGHTEFKDSALGRIPKSWEVKNLETISDFITKGSTPTTYGFDWQEQGVLFLKSESVKKGEFTISGSMRISQEAHQFMKRSIIHGGDILVSITGYIGYACTFPMKYSEANINQHIAKVRIKNQNLSKFVMYYLNSDDQYRRYLSIQTGQAYPQLSLQQIRDTFIPVPIDYELSSITSILDVIDKNIDSKKLKLHQTQSLKKSLMQDLLTGKVRVSIE
jgi:type I restriction enzyme, S subunit